MSSKEIQLSLAFCSALASIILIFAPVSQTTALAGSGTAFLISAFCFYGGISKYFADKEKQTDNFAQQVFQLQNRSAEKFKEISETITNLESSIKTPLNSISETLTNMSGVIKNINVTAENIGDNFETLNNSAGKIIAGIYDLADLESSIKMPLNSVSETLTNMSGVIKNINVTAKNIGDNFETLNNSAEKIVEGIDDLAESEYSIKKSLNSVSETLTNMSDVIKNINVTAENIESHGEKFRNLNKTAKEILEGIETLSESVNNISELKEEFQQLTAAINRQEQFYKTTLEQCNAMNSKDVELIENLAKKLQ